ncbi:hypothetical protein ABEB36_003861 [Hypothenemus hampei]|uniref:Beta-alanine-activating enzyme n=1 Tax=Hypothenemus hampei TaxID=57062 RepID=A0ABD1F1Z2_HYPHA
MYRAECDKHKIGEADTIYWGTPLTFDPTLVELLLGLLYGCTLYIVPEDVHLNPTVLHRVLFQIGAITCLQMVPSVFLRWTKQEITKILLDSSLRILILGGEQFPQEIIEYERKPDMKVFNIYGVTELSCWATIADLTVHTPRDEIPLGTALDDTYLEISNENEIYICSYTRYCLVNENQKPKSPFKVNSGDVGKLCNGILYFSGRKMRIIKRFGQKLVLHQVENVIFDQIGLRIRLVFSESHKKLLAFVLIEGLVNEGLKHRTLDKIRVKILNIVPEYSIPDFMDVVTHFPLNEHGKINEKALIKRYEESLHQSNHLQTVAENFTHILSEYLKYDLSGNLMKFQKYTLKEMGGNSYMTIQFLQTFEDKIGLKVPENLVKLLLNHTIEDCLKFIKENMSFKIKRKFIDDEALLANKRIPQLQESSIWFKYNLDGCVDASPLAFSFKESKYVACGSFAHKFVILHSETGEEYLKLQTEQEIAAQSTLSECGNYILVGSTNGCIYCIDLSLKSIRWQYQTGQQIKSAACNCSSTAIVFGSYDEFLYCLNVQDGSLIWKTKLFGQIRGDPLYENTLKIIYIGTTKGMCYAVNSENGHVIWSVDLQEPIFGSPAILEDCSIWTTVTGKIMKLCNNLVSSSHLKVDGRVFSSLKVYGEMAYFTCQDKYLYKISIRNFQLEKIVQCAGEISSSPFVFQRNTEVFVACACNSGILYIIDVNQKNILVQMHLPAETFSSPYVLDDKLYIGCRDDYLYCLNLEKLLILETE